jgi:Protein of unknown function with PCYCGC motif
MGIVFGPGARVRRVATLPIPFLFVLVLGGATVGCSADHSGDTAAGATAGTAVAPAHTPEAHATMAADAGTTGGVPTAEQFEARWAARPAFVSDAGQRTQTAYAYAVSRPDVLQWLPCYCGCGAMGHASNLDCFIKPTEGAPVVFEEHGSYCDVCVDIALMANDMLARGQTLIQVRAAVDSSFGGLAPGTPTELPPA